MHKKVCVCMYMDIYINVCLYTSTPLCYICPGSIYEHDKKFISIVVLQKWFYHLKCLILGQVCSVFVSSEHIALDFICTSANGEKPIHRHRCENARCGEISLIGEVI